MSVGLELLCCGLLGQDLDDSFGGFRVELVLVSKRLLSNDQRILRQQDVLF